MRAARAFDLPPPVLPIELVMVVEATAASRASVRKDFLPVHAYDAAAGVCIAVPPSAPCPLLQCAECAGGALSRLPLRRRAQDLFQAAPHDLFLARLHHEGRNRHAVPIIFPAQADDAGLAVFKLL